MNTQQTPQPPGFPPLPSGPNSEMRKQEILEMYSPISTSVTTISDSVGWVLAVCSQ